MARSAARRSPTSEEFLADVEGKKSQPVLCQCNDMMSATNFLAETGEQISKAGGQITPAVGEGSFWPPKHYVLIE
jgi:hypothetical protein